MSTYEGAIQAGLEAWHTVESPRQNVRRIVGAFLAALPPSILVDGKVVPLHNDVGDFADWIPDVEWLTGDLMALLDAAREVANAETT